MFCHRFIFFSTNLNLPITKKRLNKLVELPLHFIQADDWSGDFFTNSERDMVGKCWSHHGPGVMMKGNVWRDLYRSAGKEMSLTRSRPKVKSLVVMNNCLVHSGF